MSHKSNKYHSELRSNVIGNLTIAERIDQLLANRRKELLDDGYPKRLVPVQIRKYKKELTGKSCLSLFVFYVHHNIRFGRTKLY